MYIVEYINADQGDFELMATLDMLDRLEKCSLFA